MTDPLTWGMVGNELFNAGMGSIRSAGSSGLGGIMGLMFGKRQDRRERKQAKKIGAINLGFSKDMADYNQQLGLDFWNQTNVGAQVEHLKNANLSTGLMYGGSGAGGSTQGQGGNVSGGSATRGQEGVQGMAIGLEIQRQQAEIENIKAQTKKAESEADYTKGVRTEIGHAQIAQIAEKIESENLKQIILGFDAEISKYEAEVAKGTYQADIYKAWADLDKLNAEVKSAVARAEVDKETAGELIKQATLTTASIELENNLRRAKLIKTDADIEMVRNLTGLITQKMMTLGHQRAMDWEKLSRRDEEILIKQALAEIAADKTEAYQQIVDFQTSTAQKSRQWIRVWAETQDNMMEPIRLIQGFIPFASGSDAPARAPIGF